MTGKPAPLSTIEDVRRNMSRSQATRVARTRQAIFEAVASIDDEAAVTVGEVVRRAGISRAAFYTHFSGLDELAIAIMRDMVQTVSALHHEARGTTYASWREASVAMLRRTVDHMVQNRRLYLSVLEMPGSSGAFDAAVVELAGSIVAAFERMADVLDQKDVEDMARFIASGTLTMIIHWMRTNPSMPVDEMVARLISFFPNVER
ncbi:TetR/AcrR family transcriptional regulator [Amycolatopsis pithecellobii]|uniref:TetR family transcriptional regulator n=1 Tax=Amycolatopsis pithecellobii TaxID=664692 RepID=A0A6N7YY41_9PSEU|nr:TetR/AcrR family transcriptional regulator [Amycolatopsis pithecellobii]MTD53813.1 TetR family transcriptional regulator [Amycolatopsis pithecellobii]